MRLSGRRPPAGTAFAPYALPLKNHHTPNKADSYDNPYFVPDTPYVLKAQTERACWILACLDPTHSWRENKKHNPDS